jgi:hypothetical protein
MNSLRSAWTAFLAGYLIQRSGRRGTIGEKAIDTAGLLIEVLAGEMG